MLAVLDLMIYGESGLEESPGTQYIYINIYIVKFSGSSDRLGFSRTAF